MLHPDRVIGKQVTITTDFGFNPLSFPSLWEDSLRESAVATVSTEGQHYTSTTAVRKSILSDTAFSVLEKSICCFYVQNYLCTNIQLNYLIYMCMHMYRYWKYVHKICTKNKYIYICRSVITPRKANTYVYAVCICW